MRHLASLSEITLEAVSEAAPYTEQQPVSLIVYSDQGLFAPIFELLLYGSADDFENLSDWARDCARARRR